MRRVLPLVGGRNFRDLGGYLAADGRSVPWRSIYRSGSMVDLTAVDCAHLTGLGIRVVCDFRTPIERRNSEPRWLDPGVERLTWLYDAGPFGREGLLRGMSPTRMNFESGMIRQYESLPANLAGAYRDMFASIIAGRLPMVLSCSAGKDRTGLASALVLAALGVSWKDIIEDYCLTNELIDLERIYFRRNPAAEELDALHQSYANLSPYDRAPLLVASPAYLEAAFNAMRMKHGSVESYLESALGVSQVHIDRLRDSLLVG